MRERNTKKNRMANVAYPIPQNYQLVCDLNTGLADRYSILFDSRQNRTSPQPAGECLTVFISHGLIRIVYLSRKIYIEPFRY